MPPPHILSLPVQGPGQGHTALAGDSRIHSELGTSGEESRQLSSHTRSVGAARKKSCRAPAEHTRKAAASCRSPEEAVTCCLQPVVQSLPFLLEYALNKGLFSPV